MSTSRSIKSKLKAPFPPPKFPPSILGQSSIFQEPTISPQSSSHVQNALVTILPSSISQSMPMYGFSLTYIFSSIGASCFNLSSSIGISSTPYDNKPNKVSEDI
jgi:hypothetical protein